MYSSEKVSDNSSINNDVLDGISIGTELGADLLDKKVLRPLEEQLVDLGNSINIARVVTKGPSVVANLVSNISEAIDENDPHPIQTGIVTTGVEQIITGVSPLAQVGIEVGDRAGRIFQKQSNVYGDLAKKADTSSAMGCLDHANMKNMKTDIYIVGGLLRWPKKIQLWMTDFIAKGINEVIDYGKGSDNQVESSSQLIEKPNKRIDADSESSNVNVKSIPVVLSYDPPRPSNNGFNRGTISVGPYSPRRKRKTIIQKQAELLVNLHNKSVEWEKTLRQAHEFAKNGDKNKAREILSKESKLYNDFANCVDHCKIPEMPYTFPQHLFKGGISTRSSILQAQERKNMLAKIENLMGENSEESKLQYTLAENEKRISSLQIKINRNNRNKEKPFKRMLKTIVTLGMAKTTSRALNKDNKNRLKEINELDEKNKQIKEKLSGFKRKSVSNEASSCGGESINHKLQAMSFNRDSGKTAHIKEDILNKMFRPVKKLPVKTQLNQLTLGKRKRDGAYYDNSIDRNRDKNGVFKRFKLDGFFDSQLQIQPLSKLNNFQLNNKVLQPDNLQANRENFLAGFFSAGKFGDGSNLRGNKFTQGLRGKKYFGNGKI